MPGSLLLGPQWLLGSVSALLTHQMGHQVIPAKTEETGTQFGASQARRAVWTGLAGGPLSYQALGGKPSWAPPETDRASTGNFSS
jgi:hypothetical protein